MNIKALKDGDKVDRYKKIIRELKSRLNLDNQKDVAAHFGYTESGFSQILNGIVPDTEFVKKLYKEFPDLNLNWLSTGEGDMLAVANNSTVNAPVQVGVDINANSTIDKALNEIAAQRKMNEALQGKLFELIDKLTGKL